MTALLFAAVHMKWQDIVCIIPMGVILGVLRYQSGSLLPSIFAHASFNAVAMGQLAARQEDFQPSKSIIGLTVAASALVIAAIVWLGRQSESAEAARAEDVS